MVEAFYIVFGIGLAIAIAELVTFCIPKTRKLLIPLWLNLCLAVCALICSIINIMV